MYFFLRPSVLLEKHWWNECHGWLVSIMFKLCYLTMKSGLWRHRLRERQPCQLISHHGRERTCVTHAPHFSVHDSVMAWIISNNLDCPFSRGDRLHNQITATGRKSFIFALFLFYWCMCTCLCIALNHAPLRRLANFHGKTAQVSLRPLYVFESVEHLTAYSTIGKFLPAKSS